MNSNPYAMAQALNVNEPNPGNADESKDSPDSNPPPQIQRTSSISKAADFLKETSLSASDATKERLTMEGQLRQARVSLERYVNPKILKKQINEDTTIPKWVLKRAKGLVFLTVIKAGFLFAGNVGTGCVIVRKKNGGWTGPSSVGVAGLSFGFLAGASKIDYIMILPDDHAVRQFTGKGQLRLGGELQLALGPVGRDANASGGVGDKGVSVIYSYSHAQGLYGGLALDGKVISVRPDCNKAYYKRSVECVDILNGNIDELPHNESYDMIIHLLDSYCLDTDMTPIKGEKLSMEDLNNQSDEKKEDVEEETMAMKVQSGFSKLTSSVSQKFLSLTSKNELQNESKTEVTLEQSAKKGSNVNSAAVADDNSAKYQIGAFADDEEEAPEDAIH